MQRVGLHLNKSTWPGVGYRSCCCSNRSRTDHVLLEALPIGLVRELQNAEGGIRHGLAPASGHSGVALQNGENQTYRRSRTTLRGQNRPRGPHRRPRVQARRRWWICPRRHPKRFSVLASRRRKTSPPVPDLGGESLSPPTDSVGKFPRRQHLVPVAPDSGRERGPRWRWRVSDSEFANRIPTAWNLLPGEPKAGASDDDGSEFRYSLEVGR